MVQLPEPRGFDSYLQMRSHTIRSQLPLVVERENVAQARVAASLRIDKCAYYCFPNFTIHYSSESER